MTLCASNGQSEGATGDTEIIGVGSKRWNDATSAGCEEPMSYNEKLIKGRIWVYGIGLIVVAVALLWKALVR